MYPALRSNTILNELRYVQQFVYIAQQNHILQIRSLFPKITQMDERNAFTAV